MDIIRIIIEPRYVITHQLLLLHVLWRSFNFINELFFFEFNSHPSLANKLKSTFFRVTITGTTIFTPQLVSSTNSSVLVYEAPLIDQGMYKIQARILFYDYPEIYSF